MRKAILWVLIALLALSAAALAETVPAAALETSLNSYGAVRTATDLYCAIPAADSGEMLVRLPLGGGDAICVDRGDKIEDLVSYSGGVTYLKTTANASAIMCCIGNNVSTLYGFGSNTASNLSVYGDDLLVLNNGLLYSINPNTQVCLKLSGAQILDYVLGDGCAYYISDSDKMEYTAQLGNGETATTQAGCIYRLDLATGETMLLLKSGGTDLQVNGANLYFHNLADAYAVRATDTGDTELCGRLYSLDAQLKTLNKECEEPDSGFWAIDESPVVLYNNALNMNGESLYSPENGSSTFTDGERLYVWEPVKKLLTEIQTSGETQVLYEKDLAQAVDLEALIPIETPAPETEAEPLTAATTSSDWFEQFIENKESAEKTASSAGKPSSSSAKSATGSTVTTSDGVKLRSGPGSSYSQVGSVPAGASLTCIGEATAANGSKWYQVNYNGQTGYVYSGYAKVTGTVPQTAQADAFVESAPAAATSASAPASTSTKYSTYNVSGKYALIKNGSVNLRKGPGTAFGVITSIPKGAYATFLNLGATNNDGSHWYKVKYNGSTGWVSKSYATITNSKDSGSSSSGSTYDMSGNYIYTAEGSVNVRKSPSKDAASLGTVSSGKYLDFLGKGSTDSRGVRWYKVDYNGKTGWVSSKYCVVTKTKDGTGGDDFVKTTGSVNLRKGPGLDYGTVASVKAGKKLDYLGTSKKDSRGVRWYKVEYNGKTCWVSSKHSTLIS